MSIVRITETILSNIATAIRNKLKTNTTYAPNQMADAIASISNEATLTTKNIIVNGTYNAENDNVDGYNTITVTVPNTYPAGDEGKVVSNGALVSQTARPSQITENGTYDTTANNSVTVNISGGESGGGYWATNNLNITNSVGVTIQNKAIINNVAQASGYEYSAGYEGINIGIFNLQIGHDYTVSFDYQTISGGFFSGQQYTLGFKISGSDVRSYPTSSYGDSSYIPLTRDFTKHSYSTQFTASAENMYLVIAMVGYQDQGQNVFEITNMIVEDNA